MKELAERIEKACEFINEHVDKLITATERKRRKVRKQFENEKKELAKQYGKIPSSEYKDQLYFIQNSISEEIEDINEAYWGEYHSYFQTASDDFNVSVEHLRKIISA